MRFLEKISSPKNGWLKKAGIAGFLFFLVKGLVWIGVAIWAWSSATE